MAAVRQQRISSCSHSYHQILESHTYGRPECQAVGTAAKHVMEIKSYCTTHSCSGRSQRKHAG